MNTEEENYMLRYNYKCLENEYNQYKETQTKRNEFLQYKLNMIRKELKNVLLGKSYTNIENIYNMNIEEYSKMKETE